MLCGQQSIIQLTSRIVGSKIVNINIVVHPNQLPLCNAGDRTDALESAGHIRHDDDDAPHT